MIAARLAGGNLFLPFWVGNFVVGDFLEHSEQLGALGALGFFLRGFFGWGILFLGGWGVFWIESVGKN